MNSTTPRSLFSIARLCEITLFGGSISATAAGQCYYTWQEIPNPPGWVCQGGRINNHGHIAGNLANIGENMRGYTWTPETGTRVLPFPNGAYDMTVTDMNDAGQVTGWATSTALGWFGFVWDGSSYTIIPRPDWATQIRPAAINNAGQVVGTVTNNVTGPQHAFVWANGVITDLGELIGTTNSWASSINEIGFIAGKGRATDTLAFVVEKGAVEWLAQPAGIMHVDAFGLNNTRFVAGSANRETPSFRRLAVVWTPWDVQAFEPPSGTRQALFSRINDSGRAVGSFQDGYYTAIAWQSGQICDLRPVIVPPVTAGAMWAEDINVGGQIVLGTSARTVILNPIWLRGDLSGDCRVGMEDLIVILANFGSPPETFPRGDVDLDGDVDIEDLAALLSHWGE